MNERKFGKLNSSVRAVSSSNQYVVEHFGPQMPIAVTESLIHSPEAKANATVRVNPECGWGWYVFGRKLLVWQVLPSHGKIPPTVLSRELSLPSSDLAHSANLIIVYVEQGNQSASCMAVSPEGTVRYWQSIGQYSSWFDTNTNFGGEEVCAVHYIPPQGCLTVTTSGSMILLKTSIMKGMPSVTTTDVCAPHGWINTIGRKMSSVIFGLLPPSHGLESKVVKVLTRQRSGTAMWHVFLMSGLSLQSWNIAEDGVNTLFFECDLTYMIKEAFQVTLREETEITFLDMRYSETGLMFLAVCSNPRNYMIVEFLMENEKTAPREFIVHSTFDKQDAKIFEGMEDKVASNLQFLPLTSSALVFNNRVIFGIKFGSAPSESDERKPDRLDIPGGYVLGGQMYGEVPIFFSTTYGFVSVAPIDSSSHDVISSASGTLSSALFFESDNSSSSSKIDRVSAIKTAFIHYVRKNMKQCKSVIIKEFSSVRSNAIDTPLTKTLIKVSLDIMNDMANKDPRWGETKSFPNLPGAVSLHLESQLSEKLHAHDLFLLFVRELSLSEELGRVNLKGYPTPVKPIHILFEHNEKIEGMIALKKIYQRFRTLIDDVIEITCTENGFQQTPEISCNDYFFRHVSLVNEWIRNLCEKCSRPLPVDIIEIKQFADLVLDSNTILVVLLQAVIKKRSSRASHVTDIVYQSWLTSSGNKGLFDYLINQVNVSYILITDHKYAISVHDTFLEQMFLLCDVILFSQKDCSPSQKFIDLRGNIIRPFVILKDLRRAVQLAEKYKDFEILIEICYNEGFIERLLQYMKRYEVEGFCETMFEWFIREGKKSELLDLEIPMEFNQKLLSYLENFPSIAWLHTVKLGDVSKSAKMLMEYGMNNSSYAIKIERALALAQIGYLASGNFGNDLCSVMKKFQLLSTQKKLKESLLQSYGFTTRTVRPLSASELIKLFICEENVHGTDTDFIYALNLLSYIDPEQVPHLKTEIWVKAILRDTWESLDISSPLEVIHKLLVFKLMELVISNDMDPDSLIPSMEEILCHDELNVLNSNTLFRYMMSYGFEYYLGSVECAEKNFDT